jgi:polyisoprenoid-binding protein YceI
MIGSFRNAFLGTVAFGALFASPSVVEAAEYTLDPYHSKAEFKIRHMMISNVSGEFAKVSGTAQYDGKDVKSIKVDATIDAASIDTGNEDRDKHLRGKDFFETDKFPSIKFVSKSSKAAGKGKFKLSGDLTMHGVTKPVVLDVEGPTPEINDKHGNMKLGAEATTVINRKDFGITYNSLMDNGGAALSDEVKITLNIELSRPAEKKAEATK